jgi:ATP-dependent DNA helicase RecG
MSFSPLTPWLPSSESVTVEFKKSTAEKDRACRTLCAFANGQGGRVLFGVTPAGKPVGQMVSDRTLEELAREFQNFEPPLFPTVERVPVESGREALVASVARCGRLVSFRGVPYERVLNTTRVMPRDAQQRLLIEELHATERWENQPAKGWDVSRLDLGEMNQTLTETIRRGRINDPGTREPMDILRGMNLLTGDGKLMRAAVALFCKQEFALPDYPQFLLKVARFRSKPFEDFLDNRQFHGNAFALMRQAERFLIEYLPIAGRVVPGTMVREDTPLFPVEALRETLANAFVHREYAIGSGSVGVALYDDRLEIISIGDLHFGLTPEALTRSHASHPWNPLIAQAFYRRGIIETWGRGTLKVAELMRAAGLEPPVMTVRAGGAVVVTFDVAAARKARGWLVEEDEGAMVKTPLKTQQKTQGKTQQKTQGKTQQKTTDLVLAALRQAPAKSREELALQLNKSESAIYHAIRKLRESGRLQRIGPDKGGHWKVLDGNDKEPR